MKSNLKKLQNVVKRLIKEHGECLIIPTSHNNLNQIDIALKRIGFHGQENWTPRLARNTVTTHKEYDRREYYDNQNHSQVYGSFTDPSIRLTVFVSEFGNISQMNNHYCGVDPQLHVVF